MPRIGSSKIEFQIELYLPAGDKIEVPVHQGEDPNIVA